MGNINTKAAAINPAAFSPEITEVVTHVDSIKMRFRSLPHGIRTEVEKVVGKRIRIEPNPWGYSIWVHQPDAAVMQYVAKIEKENRHHWAYRLSISEVHIAVEFIVRHQTDARALQWQCEYAARLKWRRAPTLTQVGGTGYQNKVTANRNLVSYSDRASKTRPNSPCLRLEVRLKRQAVIRYELEWINAIIALNPHEIFCSCVSWFDFEPLIAGLVGRKKKLKQITNRRLHAVQERFRERAYLAYRYRCFIRRYQVILDGRCRLRVKANGLSELIPSKLEWKRVEGGD